MKKLSILFAIIIISVTASAYNYGLNVIKDEGKKKTIKLVDQTGKSLDAVMSEVRVDINISRIVKGYATELPIVDSGALNSINDILNKGLKPEYKFSIDFGYSTGLCFVKLQHESYKFSPIYETYQSCKLLRIDHENGLHSYIVTSADFEYVFAAYIDGEKMSTAFIHTCMADEFFKELADYKLN